MNLNTKLQDKELDAGLRFRTQQRKVNRRLANILAEAYADVINQINGAGLTDYQARRLDELARGIRTKLRAAYAALGEEFNGILLDTVGNEIAAGAKRLNDVVGVAWANSPSAATVYSAAYARPFQGKLLREYYKDLPDSLSALVKAQMRIGYQGGETTTQVVARVRRILKGKAKNFNRAVINTAMTHYRGNALMALYKSNADAMRGIKWNATLDTHTTDFCINTDGEIFALDKVPTYPNHFNERSILTPELKRWQDQKTAIPERTRSSMDGKVSDKERYIPWLEKGNFSRKTEAIGITRAKLNREGVPIADMYSSKKLINLSELRKSFPTQYDKITGSKI